MEVPVEGHDGLLYEKDMLKSWQSSYQHSRSQVFQWSVGSLETVH